MANERVILPQDLFPSHYHLELTPDLENLCFTCHEEIVVEVRKETTEVTLHAREIALETVSFRSDVGGEEKKAMEFSYHNKLHTVKITFEDKISVGSGRLIIKYRGILNGDMAGFYKSSYSDANGNKKVMASTQFEALDARRAFPCWDEPGVKATFTVTLIVPCHLTALSNMPETAVTHLNGPKNLKRVVFEKSPKMSTYLLAWAVGEMDFVQGVSKNGVTLRVFCPPGRADQGRFSLDVGIRSLDFYDEFFKVPYPLPKLDMLCVTEFAMGAMENWGLVTYRENALMIDEAKASPQSKQRVAIVVAHELAHQWFGNLVTMSWWDGLWLNEGFAAFMEHFCIEDLFPDYKIWEQFTTDAFGSAQRLDALKSSHPVIVPIKHAEEVEQVFDAISYCKGSTVVNMIAAILGKDKFREGLQVYMKRHAYGNTETIDLWNCWSEVSGKNIPQLMNTWTTVTGYPYLKVVEEQWSATEVKITLEQNRFLSDGSAISEEEKNTLWSIPLLFATNGGNTSEEAVIMDKKIQSFSIPLGQVQGQGQAWIKINAGQKALVRVAHSAEMINRLRSAVSSLSLSAVDRAALLLDNYALAKAGLVPLESIVEIVRAMDNETSAIVWSAIAGVLNGFSILLEQLGTPADNNHAYTRYQAFGKTLVLKAMAHVGWDPKSTDKHTDKLLRASVIGLLDIFAWNDPAVVQEARRRYDEHWENPAALPSEYKGTVYRIVLMNGGQAEYDRILKSYNDTEDNQEKKYAVNSLGATHSTALKTRTLDWAVKSGEVKLQDFFYPIASVSSSLAGTELAWRYYQEVRAMRTILLIIL
jgi:puromycin-sensitive aminopeptidase